MNGQMDPAVLAALPPSMQLDLLAQVRTLYMIFLKLTDFNNWLIICAILFMCPCFADEREANG